MLNPDEIHDLQTNALALHAFGEVVDDILKSAKSNPHKAIETSIYQAIDTCRQQLPEYLQPFIERKIRRDTNSTREPLPISPYAQVRADYQSVLEETLPAPAEPPSTFLKGSNTAVVGRGHSTTDSGVASI